VSAHCKITIADTSEGGLRDPLRLPTRSLVFLIREGSGLDGVISATDDVAALVPGLTFHTQVDFPLARVGTDVSTGQQFDLWMGRVVGNAVVESLGPS